MLGAILGDIIGSVHEWAWTNTKEFPLFVARSRFTDQSVLTMAVAEWLLTGQEVTDLLRAYYRAYPGRGYGGMFQRWASRRQREPYNSFGNGSAMRVSPVGFAFGRIEEVLAWSERSAAVTHDHPEGIRGAQTTAAVIYYARRLRDKDDIRGLLESRFGYDLSTALDQIRPTYRFDERVRVRCRKLSERFLSRRTTRTRFATRSRWAGTRTPWRALPVAWPRLSTGESRTTLQ
jgi:ADP-ribosylglycohydrolase